MIERLATSWHQSLPLLGDDLAGPLLELVLQRSTGGIALADEQGRLLRVNPCLCRRLRRSEAELLGQPWGAALGAQVSEVAEPLEAPPSTGSVGDLARARREGTSLAITLPRPDGTVEPAILSLAPLRGEGGAIRRLLLWIPETANADARGHADEGPDPEGETGLSDRWQIATNSADIGVYDIHIPSGRVLYSAAYLRNLGYASGSWMPSLEEWRNRIHPEDLERVMASTLDQRGSERVELEYRLRHRDGSWRWMLDRGRVVEWDDSGQPLRAVGTLLDVSERRQAQMELERANERMRLAARADGIGFWEYDMVADRPHWDDEMLRIYGISREEFTATGEAWEAFLHPDDQEEARSLRQSWEVSDGVLEQRFRIIRPDGEVRHIRSSALLYLLPKLRQVEVERIGLTRPCLIEGDDVQLKICVSNVMRNALQATEGMRMGELRIRVELQQHDSWVDLVVGDSGPGFGDHLPDTTVLRSSKEEGSGLGLYVVRTTLDNHGGTIHFGQSPLGGAEVRLRFPLLG